MPFVLFVSSVVALFVAGYETNPTVKTYVDETNQKVIVKLQEVEDKIEAHTEPLDYSKLND